MLPQNGFILGPVNYVRAGVVAEEKRLTRDAKTALANFFSVETCCSTIFFCFRRFQRNEMKLDRAREACRKNFGRIIHFARL